MPFSSLGYTQADQEEYDRQDDGDALTRTGRLIEAQSLEKDWSWTGGGCHFWLFAPMQNLKEAEGVYNFGELINRGPPMEKKPWNISRFP